MTGTELKYPAFAPRLKKVSGRSCIFDVIRKKWLVLTPEEWVRQHLVNYLVTEKKIPPSHISIEKVVALNGMKKRYDVVVYGRELKPWLIAECKAPYIPLDSSVVEQALRYNLTLRADLLLITNGVSELVFNSRNQPVDLPSAMSVTL